MKVLILANNDIGLYRFRKELIQQLLKDNHIVYVCLPRGKYIEDMVKMGAQYISCEMLSRHGKNFIDEIKLYRYYMSIIKKHMPDIVFTYTIKPNIYGGMVCRQLKVPYVVNITGLGSAVENGGWMQLLTTKLYKRALGKAQKVFFQNIENQDFMLNHKIIKTNYDLLPGSGVNLGEYEVMEYPRGENVDFFFLARIMKEKGIDQYLEAAKYIRNKYPQTRFHVCGFCEDEDYSAILEDYQKREIIIYHGFVQDIKSLHKISSCTVHPTYYPEGMSNVLLESCACGRPVIATDRSGCREIVDDGINGFIVQEKNSMDLIKKIEQFLSLTIEERRQMGLAGRLKVEKQFNRKDVVRKYMKEVSRVAKHI